LSSNLSELWSLLHFIEPEQFASLDSFLAHCGAMNSLEQVRTLYTFLRPVVLRRLKSDVESKLPSKEEVLIEIQLSRLQKKYYRAVYERNFSFLTKQRGDGVRQHKTLNNLSMQLRKVCQHPFLLDDVEQEEVEQMRQQLKPGEQLTHDHVMERLVSASGKFLLLDKLLPKLKNEGHRVLIFSQFTRVLDILSDFLVYRRYKFERLDGNVSASDRQSAVDRFSEPTSDIFAFLLSTRAGGLGITLTAADTVLIFDSDWNLQCDLQAMDRAHRIGQVSDATL
jgi:chromodomain-helicase-DNA-binding protein 7